MMNSKTLAMPVIILTIAIVVIFALPLSVSRSAGMSRVIAPQLQGYSGPPMGMDKPGQYAAGTIASL